MVETAVPQPETLPHSSVEPTEPAAAGAKEHLQQSLSPMAATQAAAVLLPDEAPVPGPPCLGADNGDGRDGSADGVRGRKRSRSSPSCSPRPSLERGRRKAEPSTSSAFGLQLPQDAFVDDDDDGDHEGALHDSRAAGRDDGADLWADRTAHGDEGASSDEEEEEVEPASAGMAAASAAPAAAGYPAAVGITWRERYLHLPPLRSSTPDPKTAFAQLNEWCQKRRYTPKVSETCLGPPFTVTIHVTHHGELVCSGSGTGLSKQSAKHSAAEACLRRLREVGQTSQERLLDYFRAQVFESAAQTAAEQTKGIIDPNLYPRCREVMARVHATDRGSIKTIRMVLEEYATRARIQLVQEEVPGQATSWEPGFQVRTTLTYHFLHRTVTATGAARRNKQEARHASAAAAIEKAIEENLATVTAVAGV